MDWKSIASKIMDVAPALAGALLGPAGAAVTVAAQTIIKTALGLGADATPEQIEPMITDDPETRLKILQGNQAFEIRKREIDLDEFKAVLLDIQNARSNKDNVNRNLAYGVVLSFIGMVGVVLLGGSKADSAIIGTLIGYLSAKAEQVISFYFGSSRGSQEKTEMIHNSTPLKPCA